MRRVIKTWRIPGGSPDMGNYTRFGALSRDPSPLGKPDKSSFVFGVGHVAGSLYRCLGAFAERHLNLTKLESRPRPGRPWEYVFYVDFLGGDNQLARTALHDLNELAETLKILGIYRAA